MRKKRIRRIKMKRMAKIIITAFIVITAVQLYFDLAVWGQEAKSNQLLLILGWAWLWFGQFVTLYFVWE